MRANIQILLTLMTMWLPSVAFGQTAYPWGAPVENSEKANREQAVQIVLHPAAAPRPALKYQLLPPFLDRRPGNAAVWWNRIPADQTHFFTSFFAPKGPYDKIYQWLQIPVNSPREKEFREKELGNSLLTIRHLHFFPDMERAARFESCDWELPVREGGYIAMCIPDAQQLRLFAQLIQAKAHLEIAEGRYDDAVRTLQTGYALARHAAQGQTLIHGLIGMTIAGMMSDEVRQFIQQPDAPNLYWALSTLPRPLIDGRLGGEAESNMLCLQFPELRDIDKKNLSPEQWRELWNKVVEVNAIVGRSKSEMATTIAAVRSYPGAKRYLIEKGRAAAEVEAMPVGQVVLLHAVQVYDELKNEEFKWFFLPYSESREGWDRTERHWTEILSAHEPPLVFNWLLPACRTAKVAETNCQWTLNMLRVFEAMRLYAAAHEGQWPNQLTDMTEVPIPRNPFDDRPFIYRRQGDKAWLTSEYASPGERWRQEITFVQKEK
jgi:hypothetical protein